MNKILLEEIIKHILANLLVIESDFINKDKSNSIIRKEFLIPKKIKFDLEDGTTIENNIWACQVSSEKSKLNIMLADCSQDDVREYCLIVNLVNAPTYGIYFVNNDIKSKEDESILAVSTDGFAWMECNTYLQATFLAGMENLKDLGLNLNKCTDYMSQYNVLLSFIKYRDSNYENED